MDANARLLSRCCNALSRHSSLLASLKAAAPQGVHVNCGPRRLVVSVAGPALISTYDSSVFAFLDRGSCEAFFFRLLPMFADV